MRDKALGILVISKQLAKGWKKAGEIAQSEAKIKYGDRCHHVFAMNANQGLAWGEVIKHYGMSDIIEDLNLKTLQPELLKENWYFLVWGF